MGNDLGPYNRLARPGPAHADRGMCNARLVLSPDGMELPPHTPGRPQSRSLRAGSYKVPFSSIGHQMIDLLFRSSRGSGTVLLQTSWAL